MKYRVIASLLLVLVLALLAIQQEGKDTSHTGTTSVPNLSNDEAAFKSLKIN